MSVDPIVAAVAGNADLAALVEAELAQLAADAEALRSLLIEGAVVTARVLPSNGLTDLLEIAGRRVAASLPPTVRPGDVLQVRVTGFDGERILLQVVATGAEAAVEPPPGLPVPASAPAAPSLPAAVSPPVVAASTATATATPPFEAPAAAPAVANAVPRDGAPPPAIAPGRPGPGPAFAGAVSRANVMPVEAPRENAVPPSAAAPRLAVAAPPEPSSIEARVAAARAAVAGIAASLGDAVARAPRPAPPAAVRPFVAPPAIAAKPAPAVVAAGSTPVPRASALAAYAEPVALLRALRLPVTPSNVASATLALQRPERLPDVLATLERALPRAGDDPNVATLRTLLAYVGRIDPRSPVLAAQIAAFVDHVVDGAEPKIATLLAAAREAVPPPDPDDDAPAARVPAPLPPEPPRPLPAALAAERAAVLGTDLKQTMLAVAANPATPASAAAPLAAALTALTAVQVGAAQALAAQPDGLAFTIPLATPQGPASAHISVKREAPQPRGGRLDAGNFRIAFVLETVHLGTVAIDLVTVGREVTIDVRTEASRAMRAFRDALGALTERLESLRYRVAAASASLGTTSTVALDAPPAPPRDAAATVDRSA